MLIPFWIKVTEKVLCFNSGWHDSDPPLVGLPVMTGKRKKANRTQTCHLSCFTIATTALPEIHGRARTISVHMSTIWSSLALFSACTKNLLSSNLKTSVMTNYVAIFLETRHYIIDLWNRPLWNVLENNALLYAKPQKQFLLHSWVQINIKLSHKQLSYENTVQTMLLGS